MIGIQNQPLNFRVWDNVNKEFLNKARLKDFASGFINFDGKEMIIHGGRDFEISQDTGCKDDKGNRLFVGDIVEEQFLNNPPYPVGVIVYNGRENIVLMMTNKLYTSLFDSFNYHKIGNIWENPELIKEK